MDQSIYWDLIFTDLAMSMGWSWEYIENEVTLPVLERIQAAWRYRPPLHLMVAWYFKLDTEPPRYSTKEELLSMFEQLSGKPAEVPRA